MVTGLITGAVRRVRQFMCGLHGHDALLHFETGRLSMRCTSCGHETPGWDIRPSASRAVAERKALRLPLVGERRVA